MNRDDFLMLNQDIIYFDNGATSLKPTQVVDQVCEYYECYSANAHRGDYDSSLIVDMKYEGAREKVREFIHAQSAKEIIFTSGTTDSMNQIVFGFFENQLQAGDEVLITKSEHASNVLPWFALAKRIGCKISYIPLDEELKVTVDNVKKAITDRTKVISLAQITNVVGDIRPIKEISQLAHQSGIKLVVDGAQSTPHIPVDVQDLDVDFFAFSGHKMCGPTGIGVLYGKQDYLEQVVPLRYGGGMNADFEGVGDYQLTELPSRLEAGTPNIAGALGLGAAIDYLNSIGMETIETYTQKLKQYALSRLAELDNVEVYNATAEGAIIAFNVKGIFSQDTAVYLNNYHICVRAGSHCAKMLKETMPIKNTCRISFYFYNTIEEIDRFIEALDTDDIIERII